MGCLQRLKMRYVAAAALVALGGGDVTEANINKVLSSVGIEADGEKVALLLLQLLPPLLLLLQRRRARRKMMTWASDSSTKSRAILRSQLDKLCHPQVVPCCLK